MTFAEERMITAKGLAAGRHIFLEATYRIVKVSEMWSWRASGPKKRGSPCSNSTFMSSIGTAAIRRLNQFKEMPMLDSLFPKAHLRFLSNATAEADRP